MELVLAAFITVFGSVIIALITSGTKNARDAGERATSEAEEAIAVAQSAMTKLESNSEKLDALEKQTATNGSNKTLGELSELMYADLQQTKRELAAHERRRLGDAHGRGGK